MLPWRYFGAVGTSLSTFLLYNNMKNVQAQPSKERAPINLLNRNSSWKKNVTSAVHKRAPDVEDLLEHSG